MEKKRRGVIVVDGANSYCLLDYGRDYHYLSNDKPVEIMFTSPMVLRLGESLYLELHPEYGLVVRYPIEESPSFDWLPGVEEVVIKTTTNVLSEPCEFIVNVSELPPRNTHFRKWLAQKIPGWSCMPAHSEEFFAMASQLERSGWKYSVTWPSDDSGQWKVEFSGKGARLELSAYNWSTLLRLVRQFVARPEEHIEMASVWYD